MKGFRLVAILFLAATVHGQTVPAVTGAHVAAAVSDSGVFYVYAYTVTNGYESTAGIAQLHMAISQLQGGLALDGSGLPTGLGFVRSIAALNATDPNAMPVVSSTADAPADWIVCTSMNGTMIWGARTLGAAIAPAQTQIGFTMYSKGLPGIRSFSAEPDLDVDSLPIAEPTPQTLPDYIAALVQFKKQARTTGVTVGPTAPPADFKPLDFLQTIQGYKEQALKQGWIDNPGIADSLDAKINAAQQALQAANNNTAKNILNALLNEVDAQAGKHLSSDAVALLKFNTLFLISKIS